MTISFRFCVFVALLLFAIATPSTYAQSLSHVVQDLNQKPVALSQFEGKRFTVIDFWATWCKPCLKAMPKLQLIHQKYASEGVNFVGISVDSPRNIAKIQPLARSLGVTYPVVLDPNSDLLQEFRAGVVPTLLIFDASGKERFRHSGYQRGDEKMIEEALIKLLRD